MTEEEYFRKNYPDSCYGDKPLSPHFDFFQDGVEFGERECEKKIQELEVQIEKMKCCGNCVVGDKACYVRIQEHVDICPSWKLKEIK